MAQIIIAAVVFGIIMIIQANKGKGTNGVPHGENFPFPEDVAFPTKQGSKQAEYSKTNYQSIDLAVMEKEMAKAREDSFNSRAVSNIKATVTGDNNEKEIDSEFEFDAEKAIIYSEVMNRKYF